MSANTVAAYGNDPLYREAQNNLQQGEWEQGLAKLDQLVESYPLDQVLRTLRQEMELRSKIDKDERKDRIRGFFVQLVKWTARLAVLALILGSIFVGVRSYSFWFQQQWANVQQSFENEIQEIELAVAFRNAQNMLAAGRFDEAKSFFEEVAAVDPDFPGLDVYMSQVGDITSFETQYTEAIGLIEQGDLSAALVALKDIASQEPLYQDVTLRIADIESQFFLDDLFAQAEGSFEAGEWEEAVGGYRTLRALDPHYQPDLIEDRLFRSYVNSAQAVLVDQTASLEVMEIAEDYFRKALTIRPLNSEIQAQWEQARETVADRLVRSYVSAAQKVITEQADSLEALVIAEVYFTKALGIRSNDPEILFERELARVYLKAQADFLKGRWSEVISSLKFIYSEEPQYALGTCRQTLFEAYVARGDSEIVSGQYEAALSDYQEAAILAEQTPNATLLLFETQLKIANAQGVLANYETAVLIYEASIDASFGVLVDDPSITEKLEVAERYVEWRNFKRANTLYREVANELISMYLTITYEVQSGEYLTQLANRYHTTVQAITRANDNISASKVDAGLTLVIPVPLSETQGE